MDEYLYSGKRETKVNTNISSEKF